MKYLIPHIMKLLSGGEGKNVTHTRTRSLSGGCTSNAFEVETSFGTLFVKTNSAVDFPDMFYTEVKGLRLLASTKTVGIPPHPEAGEYRKRAYLMMEFIQTGQKKRDYWTDFAQKLAALHKNSAQQFGLDHNNYIGSLPQSNTKHDTWVEFMITQRFEPLVKQALERGLLERDLTMMFDTLYSKLENLIPYEKPALLHGDLWHGNVLTDKNGEVCLVDPSVYYGHREVDLAFSTLFGAFPAEFYQAYDEVFPLENGWRERIDLFNIYPLLVHLLLLGKSYYPEVKSSVKRYVL